MENITLISENSYSLSLAVFEGTDALASIQIVHGMEEHKERYYDFAEYLSGNRFNVVISDLRGHGSDAPLLSHIADDNGEDLLIKDQQNIRSWIEKRFPGVPVILFGHSMGTIISRVLLKTDSGKYSACALSGYVCPNPASSVAVALGRVTKALSGSKGYSKLLTSLALGPYAKSIKNRKTDLDWLSYNEENVRNYQEDPLCGSEFTIGSYNALFRLLNSMGKIKDYTGINSAMPFLLIAGKDDPCTGGEKGRTDSKAVLEQAGFTNISVITYDNMRHEILNESEHRKVYEDLLNFFSSVL